MNSEDTVRSARAQGFRFFLAWFVVGGFLALVTCAMFLMAGIGGVWTPPAIWMIADFLGILVLPFVLALGGLPAAIQIAQGQAWKKTAWIAFAVCVTSWLILAGIVFSGPAIFGWSW